MPARLGPLAGFVKQDAADARGHRTTPTEPRVTCPVGHPERVLFEAKLTAFDTLPCVREDSDLSAGTAAGAASLVSQLRHALQDRS